MTKFMKSWQNPQNQHDKNDKFMDSCILCHKNHKKYKIIHKVCGFYDDWNCPMRHPHLGPKWQKWQNMSFLCFLYKNHKNHKITESLNIDSVKILMGGTPLVDTQPLLHAGSQSPTAHISRAHGVGVASPRWSGGKPMYSRGIELSHPKIKGSPPGVLEYRTLLRF